MRKIILLAIGIIAFNYSFTQQRAITERGKEVVLYDDGSEYLLNGLIIIEE